VNPRKLVLLVVPVLVLLAACGSLAPPAATVDGENISDQRVALDVNLFTALSSLSQQSCATPAGSETGAAACSRVVLNSLVQQSVVSRYARSHHVTVSVADVTKAAGGLLSQLGGSSKVDPVLRAKGLSRQDFRDLARRIVLFTNVRAAVTAERVTTAQLQQQYQQNMAQYETVHAEHILLKTRAEAEKVYQQVTAAGSTEKDFLALAKKVSTDPSAAQNSGDLGALAASSLDQTFVQAATALKPGQISKPVHTQFGWHVIRLVSVGVQPFDQVRTQIQQQLSQAAFQSWMKEQLGQADVAVNPRYGRWDAAVPAIVPVTSTSTGSPSASATPAATASP
jgi:PPIC-type PPIASE domain/SurA N-terminal domain